jgi:O-succinylbenzoate synthase
MAMLKIDFRPYDRPFTPPLQTHHGLWKTRQGILLRLSVLSEMPARGRDQTTYGEIAPIPSFGSETLEQALQFCQSITAIDTFPTIPPHLPATQFGFESAWETLTSKSPSIGGFRELPPNSTLLPTGAAALEAWRSLHAQGARTFKWKIGVAPIQQEIDTFEQLVTALPPRAASQIPQGSLRLDANGGLSYDEAQHWLQKCDRYGVEFLEQPLPPAEFDAMLHLSRQYKTPIALDESVATIAQLEQCYAAGWRGIFVVKAAIAGSPARLRSFCQNHRVDIVWSSVFETAIAQRYIQEHLIPSVQTGERAIGFGVNHWFADRWNQLDGEAIWQSL